MSSPSHTADPSSNFRSMLDAALAEYKKKTGNDLLAHWIASELQTCDSVDAVLDILRDQAKGFERSDDQKLMKSIHPLVHVLHTFSDALGDGVSLVFPPAKVIFTGIGALLAAAEDARASHGAVVDLFERIESFFKRLEVYTQISLTTKMAEVLVKIVIELLSILSIATKEVKRPLAKIFSRKLLGRTDIEDALKRLDGLIQEEVHMAIAQILKITTEVKAETNMAKWTQIEQDVHKWFSPPDPSTNYNIACKAQYEGTAAWFFQVTKFKDWMSVGSLLWIHGKPGSGKSILCSAIIKHIMSLRDAGLASLAFFYFDFRDEEKKQDFRNFVTSLLIQLSACSSPCCDIIYRLYSTHGKGTQQPSNDALKNCLLEMLSLAAQQPIYVIVDALDECPDTSGIPTPREDVLNLLEDLVRLGFPNLRICVTSRPEIDIKNVLEPLAEGVVSLHDESGQMKDICDYVKEMVSSDKKMRRWRSDEKKLVIEELSENADGMFRWVFCQLEMLRHCLPASIRETLDRIPQSLDETYLRVLNQIAQVNRAHAHRMLQCLVVAVRPLRVEELAELLAFEFDDAQGGIPKHRAAWRLDDRMQAVLSTCSSLVTIIDVPWDGGQVVQFSHFSVKEFLISNRLASSLGDISRYHIHLGSAHTILTQACLGSLLHLDHYIDEDSAKGFPLTDYAAQHWVDHAQIEDVASHVKVGMETLFDPDKPHFETWIGIHDIDEPFRGSLTREIPTPLYYSALCGFYDLVQHLIIKHPHHINVICGRYHFPLLAALCEDHVEVAELLVKLGANVDARDMTGKTILLKALSHPQHNLVSIVKFLLKNGADVNARDNDLGSSLHLLAEYGGDLEVAQMLVNYEADVNSCDNNGKTPFHILSESRTNEGDLLGHAVLLLKHGAEVNSRDKDDQTPIHLAIGRDRFRLAQLLLEHGADANAEDSNGRTPLHILSECQINDEPDVDVLNDDHFVDIDEKNEHHMTPSHPDSNFGPIQIAQALLKHGANVNAGNNGGKASERGASVHVQNNCLTPLHSASLYGRPDIARVLLEHGATANLEDNLGRTPLHLAADTCAEGTCNSEQDRVRVAQLLLKHGADVNAQDKDNATPLHLASYKWSAAMVRVLLDGGAATNSKSMQGTTPLHSVVRGRYLYCDDSDGIRIAQLLLAHGADVNAQDEDSRTPLHLASLHERVGIVLVLLDGGATTNSKDSQGRTPLHVVAEGHSCVLASLLLESGADVDVPDNDNETPLHLASYLVKLEMVLVLLDAGANACAKNAQGETPLHLVSRSLYDFRDGVGIALLLLEHGADLNAQDKNFATPSDLASFHENIEIASLLLNYGG